MRKYTCGIVFFLSCIFASTVCSANQVKRKTSSTRQKITVKQEVSTLKVEVAKLKKQLTEAQLKLNSQTKSTTKAEPKDDSSVQSIAGSKFHDTNMERSDFNNVNLSNTTFNNINMSDINISAAQMGGAKFKHIGPPPDKDGKQERQRPVTFEEMMLCDSTFLRVDMSNVKISECNTDGMTINGILVSDLLSAYNKKK